MTDGRIQSTAARASGSTGSANLAWRAWGLGALVMTALVAWPPWPPCTDLAAHVALVEALRELGTGSALDRAFVGGVFPAPNSSLYGIGYVLRMVFDVQTTARILFVVTAMATPLGWAALVRAARRPAALAWLGLPTAVAYPQIEGLLDWQLGCGVVLATLALWVRAAEPDASMSSSATSVAAAERAGVSDDASSAPAGPATPADPPRRWAWTSLAHRRPGRVAAVLGALSGVVFLCHIQATLLLGLATLAVVIAPPTGGSRRAPALWAPVVGIGLVTALLGVSWYFAVDFSAHDAGAPPLDHAWPSLWRKLGGLQAFVLDTRMDGLGVLSAFAFWAAIAVTATIGWRARRDENDGPRRTVSRPSPAWSCVAVFGALVGVTYLVGPQGWGMYWNFASRMAPVLTLLLAWALLAPALDGAPAGAPAPTAPGDSASSPARRWLWVPALVSLAITSAVWVDSVRAWNRHTEGFAAILEAAESGERGVWVVGFADGQPQWGFGRVTTWRHFGQYHTAVNRGPMQWSFGVHPGRVVHVRDQAASIEFWQPAHLNAPAALADVDVVLAMSDLDLVALTRGRLTLVVERGPWALYRVVAPE